MKLGLKNDELKVEPYDAEWKIEFSTVKNDIQLHTNLLPHQIEHIGSTAIEGIQAKPIIDILIGIDDIKDVSDTLIKELRKVGFYRLRVERPNEITFAKFTDNSYQVKTHFIHLVDYKGETWNNLIYFRDYLNTYDEAKREYENIKIEYLRHSSTGINDYTEFKEAFVKTICMKRNVE